MKDATRVPQLQSVCARTTLIAVVLVVASIFSANIASAQSTGGRVRGTVSDASGGAVVGVAVSLVNVGTNVTREATTNATGEYLFLEVPVGSYEIILNQTGFKKFVRKDVVVDLNAVVSVDIALQVGGS